jgi:hypothetical protein
MRWSEVMNKVAAALADRQLPDPGGDPENPVSLLSALTGSIPPGLRRRLRPYPLDPLSQHPANDDLEPLIYQNEFPVCLLAAGIVDVAAQAIAGVSGQECPRVTAITALSALSTLRLDPAEEGAALLHVHRRLAAFGSPEWAAALDALARRTAELDDLLAAVAGDRRQGWHRVRLEDRILGEAVAAAVVGGAAQASGVPPREWLFPFHLFCNLGVSAAGPALSTVERWLGIEFLPGPRTAARAASLAGLVADEASVLWRGCACKVPAEDEELGFARRGPCRQDDHDLRAWRPGQHKPGSRNGARYASTLWGWQRRWLGGADAGRAAAASPAVRPKLRSNDVASSVLARRWLSADRGFGGPVLRYDRILPEFCRNCGSKARMISVAGPTGRRLVQRAACCPQQHLVYRSEFIERDGRRLLRPKLGIVVASQSQEGGNAGYGSTEPLGPIWMCRQCGRYARSAGHCPECGPGPDRAHERVHHGWVLLPLAAAWADLKATAGPGDDDTAGPAAGAGVGDADLRFLADVCSKLPLREQRQLGTPGDVWALAKGWSSSDMNAFRDLAGLRGLELLFQCRQIAEAPHTLNSPVAAVKRAGALNSPAGAAERCDGPGGEPG